VAELKRNPKLVKGCLAKKEVHRSSWSLRGRPWGQEREKSMVPHAGALWSFCSHRRTLVGSRGGRRRQGRMTLKADWVWGVGIMIALQVAKGLPISHF
jgi:hypothetical protein